MSREPYPHASTSSTRSLPTGKWDPTIFPSLPTLHHTTPHPLTRRTQDIARLNELLNDPSYRDIQRNVPDLPYHYRSHHPDIMRPYSHQDNFDNALDEPPGPPTDDPQE